MRTLIVVVSTFPPLRDGIALYAQQQLDDLHEKGTYIVRIGLPGSHADYILSETSWLRSWQLLLSGWAWRVRTSGGEFIMQWHDEFFVGGGPAKQSLAYLGWWLLCLSCNCSVVCHETYKHPQELSILKKIAARFRDRLRARFWAKAKSIVFHSQAELEQATSAIGQRVMEKASIQPHGRFFRVYAADGQLTSRRMLGLPEDGIIFLCIGFFGDGKGFDSAIEAFRVVTNCRARLFVVGSALYNNEQAIAYVNDLRVRVENVSNATLVQNYVSNEDFDRWISASDYVVLPYRRAFSSGVLERAHLLGKQSIVRRVGGLDAQTRPNDYLFDSDVELAGLFDLLTSSVRDA
jgi:glycosyltransferase involved in cell wall biosynthesis